ncbi:MAG: YkgJ family cysteine cluster protein [Deltaproteobacteria bacterium]|nr:YkgJ family cysteine cluster protein [Deltaproteobacteria bacterium]
MAARRRRTKTPSRSKPRGRARGPRPRPVAAAAPPASPADPRAELLRTSTTGTLPPANLPGQPSVVPGRPPVPAPPSASMAFIGAAVLGRPAVALSLYREPPVHQGGREADMCAHCDVDCCTGHVIPLNCVDAWRIHHTLGIPFREFIALVPWDHSVPTHGVRIGEERFSMALRRRWDGSCAFLLRVGQERRCGIHAVRPDACRIFPFIPDAGMQEREPGDGLVQMHPFHCPWRWPATPEHKARVLRDIRDNEAHRRADREILSRWFWAVGVPKTAENFWEYLEVEMPRHFLRPDQKSRYLTTLW